MRFKERVTREDFRESGLRKTLNLGHTIGHALEGLDNFRLSHGEYVLWGILHETALFESIIDPGFLEDIRTIVNSVLEGRPDPFTKFDRLLINKACRKDKKNSGGKIAFSVPVAKGKCEIMYKDNI